MKIATSQPMRNWPSVWGMSAGGIAYQLCVSPSTIAV